MRRLLSVAIAVTVAAGCNNNLQLTTTSLATPVGLAVAGSLAPHLFIANADEDSIQVVDLPEDFNDTRFVRAPNLYFPLRIPAGARPTRLAASEDQRYVIVLDSATNSLLLIDADAYTKAFDLVGNEVSVALTQRGATPTDMIASTQACPDDGAEDCLARVYVALAATGVILVVDLKTTLDGSGNVIAGPFFTPVRAYDVGGEPQRLAASWDGNFVYATDNTAPQVVRIGVSSSVSSIERRDIGGIGGPVAVSRDNDVLLVGRPLSRDVVVMQGAGDGTWAVFDANPTYTPQPRCLEDCATGLNVNDTSDNPQECIEPFASDEDICVDTSTGAIRPSGQALYTAIYVDGAPTLITTLGNSAGHASLSYSCNDGDFDLDNDGEISEEEDQRNSSISVSFGEYALVVTEGDRSIGDVYWMPLKAATGAPLTPQLASAGCGRPALDIDVQLVLNGGDVDDFAPYQIGNYMADCVETPNRARFTCARDTSGGGLVVVSGNIPILAAQGSGPLQREGRWDFTWEGVLPGLDRSNGGGELLSDTLFTDVGLHSEDFQRAKVGDILEILSPPTAAPECVAEIGEDGRVCRFERRITQAVTPSEDGEDRALITFEPPLEPTCFLAGGRIAYRIRAGDQFLVNRPGSSVWRLGLTDRFGPGGDVATGESIIFELRDDLLTNYVEPPPAAGEPIVGSCNRYDETGKVVPESGQNALLSRDVRFAVIVRDGFRPYLTGRAYASSGSTLGSAGSIPGDALVYQGPVNALGIAPNPKVYITYSGNDTLVGFDPTNADNASRGVPGTQIILRN
ncbi:MAG: YncE family protein [Myxococcota bacterium]